MALPGMDELLNVILRPGSQIECDVVDRVIAAVAGRDRASCACQRTF
jgi:hypothetical protein